MGLFKRNAMVELHPISPPLGMHQAYIAQSPVTLVLREKIFSWSGDDFAVNDQNGTTVVRCQAKVMSIKDKKGKSSASTRPLSTRPSLCSSGPMGRLEADCILVITDANGMVLFNIRNKILALLKEFVAEDVNGQELFRVKKKLSFGSKMEAAFVNQSTGQPVSLELRGDMFGKSGDIALDGQVVAQISRDSIFSGNEVFFDKQTYFVTIAPGVDLALIAAICICFDEAMNDNNNNNSY